MSRSELRLRGPHNLANVLAALATVLPLEPSPDALRTALRQYGGLEHRLEPAGEVDGVRFVNDSKATNTDSLSVALQSFDRPVVLIAGGRDKGQDFTPLAPLVRRAVRHLVLGSVAEQLLARPDRLIGIILIGNTLANVTAASIVTTVTLKFGGEGWLAVADGALTLALLLFAEVGPKTYGAIHAERLAPPAAYIYRPLLFLTYPLVWLVSGTKTDNARGASASSRDTITIGRFFPS